MKRDTQFWKLANIWAFLALVILVTGGCSTQNRYSDRTQYLRESENVRSTKTDRHAAVVARHSSVADTSETPPPKKREIKNPARTIEPPTVGKIEKQKPPKETNVNLEGDDVKLEGNR